ncbi:1,4-dihydroxy-2-naphthoate octaprenyltransferase [Lachnotalea glycerini]|uniref:Prenyltransferase n=1 Tax=Lachnotalea glycerini TaxID=1763509 RepID=A0A255IBA3_9FIRM|nr:UbiA family prenyltransferase [Lachnotalea glycerini]PXV91067.1 1,4-dihydroxy-2-naphthoate octaprenyltransferase [Lachnotalea glycerini]RDY30059.1 prenyltransferase [Lachnotalea glycerini]
MIKKFFNYIEIKTKITSTFTFAMTIGFLLYHKQVINWKLTIIFFFSMFLFDLATTAINNYIDSKDNGQILDFSRKTSLYIIYILFAISTVLGLYLAYLSDLVILATGAVCFLCGVLYTYGPVPISRQPLGEILSGFFYGVMIPFILMYINTPSGTFLSYQMSLESVYLKLQIAPIISLLLFAAIPFCLTANIMLANNICDLEKDIKVKRFTLPYYIGEKALPLFAGLYYATYIATVLMVIFKILSPICLFSLLSIILVQKNINQFLKKQEKASTFMCSIKNFVIVMGANTTVIFISLFF